jgi:general secretion pathway protein H
LPARGFTLLELLVVLVIVGITMGFITLKAMPDQQQRLQNEAQRLALLMQLARDEAILRNRPIAFESGSQGYRFLVREENTWQQLNDEMLRPRDYPQAPLSLTISPAAAGEANPLRIVFGREPVDKPFVLTLASSNATASVRADGVGHFSVE